MRPEKRRAKSGRGATLQSNRHPQQWYAPFLDLIPPSMLLEATAAAAVATSPSADNNNTHHDHHQSSPPLPTSPTTTPYEIPRYSLFAVGPHLETAALALLLSGFQLCSGRRTGVGGRERRRRRHYLSHSYCCTSVRDQTNDERYCSYIPGDYIQL